MGTHIIGIVAATIIVTYSILASASNRGIYADPLSFLLVIGGTLCAMIITYTIKDILHFFRLIAVAFRKTEEDNTFIVGELVEIADKSRGNQDYVGKKLLDCSDLFLKDSLQLLIDGFEAEDIKSILWKRTQIQKDRDAAQINIVKSMSKYPPAFGMIGTIIGLVALLEGLGDIAGTSKIGPNMAIALITTLYGVIFANYFFIPIADNLQNRTYETIIKRQIVMEGILLIKAEESPLLVQEKLNSYLPPLQRKDFLKLGTRSGDQNAA